MADELIINVKVDGESTVEGLDKKMQGLNKTASKTETEMQKLRKEVKEAKNVLLTAEEGTDAYAQALARAANAQFKLRDINDKTRLAVQDFGQTGKNVAQAVSGLAGGFSVLTGVMALFGVENDAVAKTLLKVQSAMAIATGVGQFADAIDNMRDLIDGLKASAEAAKVAQSATEGLAGATEELAGGAAKATTTVGKQLLTMGLWVAAIAAVVVGITLLIEKMNEVPKELELDIKLSDESIKSTEAARIKIAELKHDLDTINGKNDTISKKQLTAIKEVMEKQGIATKEELKGLGTKASAYDKYFDRYLKKVTDIAKEEAIIKGKVSLETEVEKGLAVQEKVIESIRTKLKAEGKDSSYIDAFIKSWTSGSMEWSTTVAHGLSGQITLWNSAIDKIKSSKEELAIYNKLYSDFQAKQKKAGNEPFIVSGTPDKQTKKEPIFGLPLEQEMRQRLKEYNENQRRTQEEETKKNMETWGAMTKPALQEMQDPFDHLQWLYDNDYSNYDDYLKAKKELLEMYGMDTNKINEEINQRELEKAQAILGSIGNLTNSIANLYDSQMQSNQSAYEAQVENINNTVSSEEEKNAKLKALDKEFNKNQEKLFEQQKIAKIATAWMDFAAGTVSLWSRSSELGLVAGPIVAGIETAALLATTIANTQSIAAQKFNKATSASGTSTSASTSAAVATALTPNKTALTTKDEILNTNVQQKTNVVLVSDINKVQQKVKVREQNSTY